MSIEANAINQENLQKQVDETTTAFKWFHAVSLNFGPMTVVATTGTYFSLYMTDTVGISTATAAMIMFIATLWDAINDPMMGVLADRTTSRWGRYRPYFVVTPIIFTIACVFLFINPTWLEMSGKVVYVAGFYILLNMCTTMLTMPQVAILPAATKSESERNKIIGMGGIFLASSFTIGSTFTPKLTEILGGFPQLMAIYGVITIIAYWGLFATSTEKYISVPEKKSNIGSDMKKVFGHKEIYPLILVWILASVGYGFMFSSSVYYMMYFIARPDLIALYMGIISIGAFVSMAIIMPIALKFFKTGTKTMLYTQLFTFIFYVIAFFFGENLMVLYICSFIATAIGGMSNVLVKLIVNDAIDFIQLKEQSSMNGVIASIQGFAKKGGATITNTGILALLALSGYIPGAIGQQTEMTMTTLNILRFGIPALICISIVICMKFYPLNKYRSEIEEMKNNF